MTKTSDRNNWWTIIAGLIGCFIGPVILLLKNDSASEKAFAGTPQFTLWLMLIGLQTSLWSVLALAIWRELRPLKPFRGPHILQLICLFLALSVLTWKAIIPIASTEQPLHWHKYKMGGLQLLGMLVGVLAMHGIWLLYGKLDEVRSEISATKDYADSIGALLVMRTQLDRFLFSAGMIIGAATLATGALRLALIAIGKPESLPREYILLYGIAYSLFLALIYWPVHVKFQSVGGQLRDKLVPFPKTKDLSWAAWNANRKALDDLLQLQTTPLASLHSTISILSPLVGSMAGLLLGGKS